MNSSRRLPPTAPDQRRTDNSPKLLRRRLGSFDWLVTGPFQPAAWLGGLEHPQRLLEPPAEALKRIVVPGREVVRVRGADATDGDLVVKHFAPRGLLETVKWSWRASPANRAFELARHVRALGVGTAAPVAAGERRCWGWLRESFLLMRHIPGAVPLYLINANCVDRTRRTRIVRHLARIYAALHDAGFYHSDPSQTNFLAVPQLAGDDALVLIDLDGLRWGRRMNLAAAAKDLRRLLSRGRVPRHERAWFIAAYARARKVKLDVRQLVARIGPLPAQVTFPHCALNEAGLPENESDRPAVAAAQPCSKPAPPSLRAARMLTTHTATRSHTETRRRGELTWLVRPARFTAKAENILAVPDQFLERARVLKPSRSSAVSAQDGLVLKRYNLRKWSNVFLDLFRGSRGRRAFHKAYHLELCGIATARPIATADQRLWFLPVRSYLLMEEIQGAVPVGAWNGPKPVACKAVAGLLARLHREGFTHRDLKDGNIVFDEEGRPHLIDLDGLRFIGRVSDSRAAADLARLARDAAGWQVQLSRSDRARFLAAYCRARRLRDWRWWWRTIDQRLRD